jgi:hypothetical protein
LEDDDDNDWMNRIDNPWVWDATYSQPDVHGNAWNKGSHDDDGGAFDNQS